MNAWLSSELAKELFANEQALLDQVLPQLAGYVLIQHGFVNYPLFESSPISRKWLVQSQLDLSVACPCVCAYPEQLPFADESVDVVILQHSLDISEHPHQILREASRVLLSGGHAVVIGFNPYSFWGIRKFFNGFFESEPWNYHFFRRGRLKDWYRLLDLHTVSSRTGFMRPPINVSGLLNRFKILDNIPLLRSWAGAFHITVLKKEKVGMIPVRLGWKEYRLLEFPVITPVTTKVSRQRK